MDETEVSGGEEEETEHSEVENVGEEEEAVGETESESDADFLRPIASAHVPGKSMKKASTSVKSTVDKPTKVLDPKEMEERRANIEKWMEKMEMLKREEFEQEEASSISIRNYLMANVIPILTQGLMEVTNVRPDDPIDFLAEYLFQNNPGFEQEKHCN